MKINNNPTQVDIVTRKQISIISSIVVCFLVGSCIHELTKGEVKAVFVGGASSSSTARFVITNSFRRAIVYTLRAEVEGDPNWRGVPRSYEDGSRNPMVWLGLPRGYEAGHPNRTFSYSNYSGRIVGRAAETIEVNVAVTNRWILAVFYRDTWMTSWMKRISGQMAQQASRVGWHRVSGWLRPKSTFDRTESQTMVGCNAAESTVGE